MSIRRYRSFNSKDMFHFASAVDTDQPDMSASSVDSSVAAPLTDSTLVAADALIDNSSNAMFKESNAHFSKLLVRSWSWRFLSLANHFNWYGKATFRTIVAFCLGSDYRKRPRGLGPEKLCFLLEELRNSGNADSFDKFASMFGGRYSFTNKDLEFVHHCFNHAPVFDLVNSSLVGLKPRHDCDQVIPIPILPSASHGKSLEVI